MNASCTSATLAVAEQTTGTANGMIYVFWKQLGTKDLFYAATTDDHATNWSHLTWTPPAQVPGAVALTAPAASVPTVNSTGPLLLVYKAPFSTHVRFQTLNGTTWSAFADVPGGAHDRVACPAAEDSRDHNPGTLGNIVLFVYG